MSLSFKFVKRLGFKKPAALPSAFDAFNSKGVYL